VSGKTSIAEAGIIPEMKRVLATHMNSAAMIAYACGALWNIAVDGKLYC